MTVKRVEVLAYAKINLMLDIIRRRTDGYHDLFMIMQSVGVADRVTVEREPGRKLRLTASIDDIPLDDKNIAWKAAALFFKTTGLRRPGLHIHLEKHIPHAAGLAGGSEYFLVEQDDTYGRDPFESLKISHDNLVKLGYGEWF